jgi:hypothetical protein
MNWHYVFFSAVTCSSDLLHAGWGPYAYFRELEESGAYSQAAATVNPLNAEPMDSHVESKEDDNDGFLGLHLARDSTMPLEDVEAGRR